ncbi:UNKNOWN [Stylonychia lemnae]|uniref:Uncharacterized protein n=1 Tax=Stylonychia lemnae TaxID=5949 RepID=A0A078AAT1_STYLE|nr:UNKNOWN [Stylonychia lemnae]|eukprot:CDW78717.1 UNKNOWN [Stylonychia lemnae]
MISHSNSPNILKQLNLKSKAITKTKKNSCANSLLKKLQRLSLQTPDLTLSCKLNKIEGQSENGSISNASISTTASEVDAQELKSIADISSDRKFSMNSTNSNLTSESYNLFSNFISDLQQGQAIYRQQDNCIDAIIDDDFENDLLNSLL